MTFSDNETFILEAPDISDTTKKLIGRFIFLCAVIIFITWFGKKDETVTLGSQIFDFPIEISTLETLIVLCLVCVYEAFHLFFSGRLDIRQVREGQQQYTESYIKQLHELRQQMDRLERLFKDVRGDGDNSEKLKQSSTLDSYLKHFEESDLPEIQKGVKKYKEDFEKYSRYKKRVASAKTTYSIAMLFGAPIFMAVLTIGHLIAYAQNFLPRILMTP